MIETMPTYTLYIQTFSVIKDLLRALFCKRPVGEGSLLTHLLRHQNWRANCVMKVMPVSLNAFKYIAKFPRRIEFPATAFLD